MTAAALDASVSTVSSSPASVTADGSTSSTVTVTATDVYGNPIAGASTTLSQGSGSSSIAPASVNTDGSGVAAFTVTDTLAETVTYQATVASTLMNQTANVQFVPGPADAAHTTITALPTSVPSDGVSTSTITVQAKDAQDNNLTSSGGVVTLSTDHGSLSAVTNNNNGTYTATLTASNAIETATVSGTIGGNAITDQATVDFTGVPSKYLVTSDSYTPTAGGSVTITAQLADQNDNPDRCRRQDDHVVKDRCGWLLQLADLRHQLERCCNGDVHDGHRLEHELHRDRDRRHDAGAPHRHELDASLPASDPSARRSPPLAHRLPASPPTARRPRPSPSRSWTGSRIPSPARPFR